MANLSFVQIAGGIGDTNFAFSFSYLAKADVHVKIAGVETFAFTWLTASTIQLTTPLAAAATVEIRRLTPNATQTVVFNNGSSLTQDDLNNSDLQKLYLDQETIDFESNAIQIDANGKYDAQSKVIENVANPSNPQDVATLAWTQALYASTPAGHAIGAHIDSVATSLAKGDILIVKDQGSSVLKYDKLAAGSNGQTLEADSTVTSGLSWKQGLRALLTTAGDMYQATSSGVIERLAAVRNCVLTTSSATKAVWKALTKGSLLSSDGTDAQVLSVGANNTILVADSAQTTGLKWVATLVGLTLTSPAITGAVTGTGTIPATLPTTGAPAAGSVLTMNPYAISTVSSTAHSLGATPTKVAWYLECLSGELGYSAFDRVYQMADSDAGAGTRGFTTFADSASVGVSTGSVLPNIFNKASNSAGAITAAKWKLVLTPFKVN